VEDYLTLDPFQRMISKKCKAIEQDRPGICGIGGGGSKRKIWYAERKKIRSSLD